MSGPFEDHRQPGFLESILRQIPGFGGYLELEARRDSDEKTRRHLADRLQRSKRGLDDYASALTDAGMIDQLPRCEQLRRRLDRLISRVRSQVTGYGSLFENREIDKDRLEDVYDCDAWLLDTVDAWARAWEQTSDAIHESPEAVADLARQLDDIAAKFDEREELLKNLTPDL